MKNVFYIQSTKKANKKQKRKWWIMGEGIGPGAAKWTAILIVREGEKVFDYASLGSNIGDV